MGLMEEVLAEERRILKELGYELSESWADKNHPESYYKDYLYNLFENMIDKHKKQYGGGSGGELNATETKPAKMASIRSSSAMTFNLLGNDTITLLAGNEINHKPGTYRIEYEKQHETISNGNRQQPANIDAFLESEDGTELIFCEMKMLEWFSKNTGQLKEAYKDENNYKYKELTIQFFKAIEIIEQMSSCGTFEYYDVWQMFKHTLAIHNYMQERGWDKCNKVTLLNVVFEPDNAFMSEKAKVAYEYQKSKEHEGFDNFRSALVEAGILKDGKNFDVKYISAKDFIRCLEISDKKLRYLRRYTLEG